MKLSYNRKARKKLVQKDPTHVPGTGVPAQDSLRSFITMGYMRILYIAHMRLRNKIENSLPSY